jgi:hypothetical protein
MYKYGHIMILESLLYYYIDTYIVEMFVYTEHKSRVDR